MIIEEVEVDGADPDEEFSTEDTAFEEAESEYERAISIARAQVVFAMRFLVGLCAQVNRKTTWKYPDYHDDPSGQGPNWGGRPTGMEIQYRGWDAFRPFAFVGGGSDLGGGVEIDQYPCHVRIVSPIFPSHYVKTAPNTTDEDFVTSAPFPPGYISDMAAGSAYETTDISGQPDYLFSEFYDDGAHYPELAIGHNQHGKGWTIVTTYEESAAGEDTPIAGGVAGTGTVGGAVSTVRKCVFDDAVNTICMREAIEYIIDDERLGRIPESVTVMAGATSGGVEVASQARIEIYKAGNEVIAKLDDLEAIDPDAFTAGDPSTDGVEGDYEPPTTAPEADTREEGPTYGFDEEEFEDAVREGLAIAPCLPPDEPPSPPTECPPCTEDPNASVPDWRFQLDGDVFLNARTCEYCTTIYTSETNPSTLNSTTRREEFLLNQRSIGIMTILEYFGKSNVTEEARSIILESSIAKQYEMPLRPMLGIKVLVCVPVDVIEAIKIIDTAEPLEEPAIGPIGCVLKAQEIRSKIKRVNEAFRFYGHKYALWSYDTGQIIPNFDPKKERKQLKKFVPALVQLMNRNGFKLNGKNAAEKVEFRFNSNYELIFAQAKEPGCEPIELKWPKRGDSLGGFKQLDPINDPRTMAYVAALNDMEQDAGARDPKAWDEFFTEYTYPPINTGNVEDPIGDPVMADGPLQQAAQAIVNDIVGLPDAIVAKFAEQVCRDRNGQAIHDADIKDFDDMLRRAIYSKSKDLLVGDDTFLNLVELLADSSNMNELYQNILNKLGRCGLLDLLSTAIACLTNGIDLEQALARIVRAALKAMDPGNLEKLFIGLPPDKQRQIKQKISEEFGAIPAPWESGYRPGSYSYKVETDPATGQAIGKDYTRFNEETGEYENVPASRDSRSVAERTAQYRMDTQGTGYGGAGSVGTAADNVLDEIFEAYTEAILDSVDAEFLLSELNKFPGAELITKALLNPQCPPPPLFNPPLNEFMKTLELDFCRGQYALTLPKFQKINIPDLYKMFMEALLEVLMQLAIKIILAILEAILKILLNGLCNLLGLLGSLASGLFAKQPTNNFADGLRQSLGNTGLNDLGIPIPLADDGAINDAAAGLFSAFSRACPDPNDLPNGSEVSDFLTDVGLILTQGEFIDLLEGIAADEVHRAIYQLALLKHDSFLCIFPNTAAIEDFFRYLGDMIDSSFLNRGERGQPVFSGVCQDVTSAAEADNLRRQLFTSKGLSSSEVLKQLEYLKCQALDDLEELVKITQDGLFADFPNLLDGPDCSTPGIIPRDPSMDDLPQGPVGLLQGPFGLFDGAFDLYEKMYYKDLMGRGGFLNLVLSDRLGKGRREHNSFVALQSVFGIFSKNPNSHEELLPVTVAKYLQWVLQHPGETMGPGDRKFVEVEMRNGQFALGYNNYFPETEDEWYQFQMICDLATVNPTVRLNNEYFFSMEETFNFTKEPAIDEGPDGQFVEMTTFEGDPGLPDGVEDFITLDLGLDIESVPGGELSDGGFATAQSAVFGKYIEKRIRDALKPETIGKPTTEASLAFIADACMTEMYEYINSRFFSYIAGIISDDNQAFKYGQGGDLFDANRAEKYQSRKIFLDEDHVYPPEHPLAGTPLPLDPLAWGGNRRFPAFYLRPPQNRPGWIGIADKFIPEVDACDPARENIIGFKKLSKEATEFYQAIRDDDRLGSASSCPIEEPCNKILSRAAAAMIEGNIRATIRIYAAEAFLKGAPAFLKFQADLNELYEDPLSAFITDTIKRGFFQHSKKGFGRRKNDEYYFQFLEQCVQNFGRKVDSNLVEPTDEESRALETINALQQIWKKDTDPSSGKRYAGTGERLARVLSPGFFGAQLKNIFNKNYNVPLNSEDGALSKKAAAKLKEESFDYFMRDVEEEALIILKRYIADELKYIGDEFSERMPPQHKTLYEIFLSGPFSTYGTINITNGLINEDITPLEDGMHYVAPYGEGGGGIQPNNGKRTVFSVAHSAFSYADGSDAEPGEIVKPKSINTGKSNSFLHAYLRPGSCSPHGPQPQSPKAHEPSSESRALNDSVIESLGMTLTVDNDRYWQLVLEQFIQIEDWTREDFEIMASEDGIDLESVYGDLSEGGIPNVWLNIMTRDPRLFGVVRASEWIDYINSLPPEAKEKRRGELWKSWSYGLRIVFVPPNESEDFFTDNNSDAGDVSFSDGSGPVGTSDRLPKSVQIKQKIEDIRGDTSDLSTPFSRQVAEKFKAFYFEPGGGPSGPSSASLPGLKSNPMSIPIANGLLTMRMDIVTSNHDWAHGWQDVADSGKRGFSHLVQELVCGEEYKMLFRYCFNMPRILSFVAIYIIQSFLPSIGKAPEQKKNKNNPTERKYGGTFSFGQLFPPFEELPVDLGDEAREFDEGEDDDGWYTQPGLAGMFGDREYYGGGVNTAGTGIPLPGLSLFAGLFTTNFKEWQYFRAFQKSKKLAAQTFMDLYNSEDPTYSSDAFSDTTDQEEARKQIQVAWPKFSLRLWSKRVDRPYDKNGDLCYNPEDDYQD